MSSRHTRSAVNAAGQSRWASRSRINGRPNYFQALESRTMLAANPIGSVDLLSLGAIAGWAHDADTPSSSISVRITIDGNSTDVVANQPRADLNSVFGPGNFGFTFAPNLAPGAHQVSVSAIDPQTNVLTLLKAGKLVNNAPNGGVDVLTTTRIAGWAFDKDVGSGPVTIRVDQNGQTVSTVTANLSRPDLVAPFGSANHGFDVSGNFTGVIDIYAIDTPSGTPVLIKSTNKLPVGNVEVLTKSTASGWVFDPDNPGAPVTVRVKVDGAVVSEVTANLDRPDVAGVTGGSTAHGFIANYSLTPGTHKIEVVAVESDTSSVSEVLLGTSGSVSNPAPIGALDAATTNVAAGWAFDADAGPNPLTVQVKVDGVLNATTTANVNRPDIVRVTGSPNHGYTANLTGVAVGPHHIEVFALDNPTGTAVKIGDKIIGNTPPRGSIDVANPTNISGWAQDPDNPTAAVQVIVVLDGTQYPAATADQARGDLTAAIGSPNHGFTVQTPTHLFGTHTVSVIAIDTFDGSQKVIGSHNFVNNAPVGNIDFSSKTGVAGWTFDKDDPTKSIDVLVEIDGTIVARMTANLARPDVASVTGGSTAHGYSVGYSGLPAGSHTLKVFSVDPATGVTALIGTKTIIA